MSGVFGVSGVSGVSVRIDEDKSHRTDIDEI